MKRQVSLKEISRKCGFSMPLVSSVLSGKTTANRCSRETYEKIITCAREMGYTPNLLAKAIATGKSPIILFSLHENERNWNLPDFYLNDLILGGSRRFAAEGLYVLYMPYRSAEEQFERIRKAVKTAMVSGVVTNLLDSRAEKPLYDYLAEIQFPAVFLGFPKSDDVVSVGVDNTPLQNFIADYARRKGFADAVQVSELPGNRFEIHPDNLPLEPELTEDETILFFAPGFASYTALKRRFSGLENRLVLLEDTRFYPGELHSILFPSAQPQVIEKSCEILSAWCRHGITPTEKRHIITRSTEEIIIHD